MDLKISKGITAKLKSKHKVTLEEVTEAILNYSGEILEDNRAQHQTKPPTIWYISETDAGRPLKLVFVATEPLTLKTAYQPSAPSIQRFTQAIAQAKGEKP